MCEQFCAWLSFSCTCQGIDYSGSMSAVGWTSDHHTWNISNGWSSPPPEIPHKSDSLVSGTRLMSLRDNWDSKTHCFASSWCCFPWLGLKQIGACFFSDIQDSADPFSRVSVLFFFFFSAYRGQMHPLSHV